MVQVNSVDRPALARTLFSIAVRGGLKAGSTLFIIALFTALVISVQALAYSYTKEAPLLQEISQTPQILLAPGPTEENALRVQVAPTKLGDHTLIVIASEKMEEYLHLFQARVEGSLPEKGQALIGTVVKSLLQGDTLPLQGYLLNITGTFSTSAHSAYAVLIVPQTMADVSIQATTLYLSKPSQGSNFRAGTEAPCIIPLIDAVSREALEALAFTTLLLEIVLALTCLIQGYTVMNRSKPTLEVFSSLNASEKSMTSLLALTAVAIGGCGTVLGYALGMISSSAVSLLLSLAAGLPYMKPLAGSHLLHAFLISFVFSAAALTLGFAAGYHHVHRR
jgi:hypothetical protein